MRESWLRTFKWTSMFWRLFLKDCPVFFWRTTWNSPETQGNYEKLSMAAQLSVCSLKRYGWLCSPAPAGPQVDFIASLSCHVIVFYTEKYREVMGPSSKPGQENIKRKSLSLLALPSPVERRFRGKSGHRIKRVQTQESLRGNCLPWTPHWLYYSKEGKKGRERERREGKKE